MTWINVYHTFFETWIKKTTMLSVVYKIRNTDFCKKIKIKTCIKMPTFTIQTIRIGKKNENGGFKFCLRLFNCLDRKPCFKPILFLQWTMCRITLRQLSWRKLFLCRRIHCWKCYQLCTKYALLYFVNYTAILMTII